MTSRYTVVQYVPNPIADERINVGVISWDDERVCSKFVADWRRVRTFGGEETEFLREFANGISELTSTQLRLPKIDEKAVLDGSMLEEMVSEWTRSIQFSEIRGSTKAPNKVLKELAAIFLPKPGPKVQKVRTRSTAASMATKSMFNAVKHRVHEEAEKYVKTNFDLKGRYDDHRFPVALANGKPLAAVHALSFEISVGDYLEREVEGMKWTVDDVRKKHRILPIAVFVLSPRASAQRKIFNNAARVFRDLNANVVTENKMDSWANLQARTIAE